MKTITIDYINGLADFLEENGYRFDLVKSGDKIKIYYKSDVDLFRIGFNFGKEYTK
ncbi:MAG: hypothetical protein RLY43_559 [Bacteroidota bacterium]|jgi:hypothetical protein